jgi:hypothetical protein
MPRCAPGWMMSSATSIDGSDAERLPDPAADDRESRDPSVGSGSSRAASRDDTLQPWHFFLLLSLLAATVAVVLAREARPEHLVLVSLTIGAAGFAGVALYRTLSPLVAKEELRPAGALTESMRTVLEREKMLVLRSIKELEFDRAMGKVSAKDFDEMAGRLRARAMSLMRQLDTEAGYRELIERELQARLNSPVARTKRAGRPGSNDPGTTSVEPSQVTPGAEDTGPTVNVVPVPLDPGSCACGTTNDADAAFCKRCGAKLAGSGA